MEFVQIFLGMAKGSALFGKAFLGCAIYRNGRIFLKRLILINGTMGAGKTAVCRELERELAPCAFLDGDWCWEMHPFQVTDETKRMVLENISFVLGQFLRCSAYETVLFCWVMQQDSIAEEILHRLDLRNVQVERFTLMVSERALRQRLERDVTAGLRQADVIDQSVQRLPLYEKMKTVKAQTMELTGGKPILELKPFHHKNVGIVTIGNEVFHGRIQDTFTPVIVDKLSEFDTEVIDHVTWDDDDKKVTASILDMIEKGADIVICTGGMSVDPDDKTPLAIKNTGARIVSYGAPVLPGAMFLLAYYDRMAQGKNRRTVIMGLPGCVMYAKRTIFDLVLPRVMADDEVTADELAALGMGGLCLNCPTCTFPNCGFGKGY